MKMKRDHAVPLPVDAVNLLKAMRTAREELSNPTTGDLIFPAPRGGELSDVVMTATMKRMQDAEEKAGRKGFVDKETGRRAVPHGMRSCFRVWAGQRGYSREHAELALAHQFGDAVEQAYQRDTYTQQRRPMMEHWADYLAGRAQADNVVELKRG